MGNLLIVNNLIVSVVPRLKRANAIRPYTNKTRLRGFQTAY